MWKGIRHEADAADDDNVGASGVVSDIPAFSPIGPMHIANLALLRQRVTVLLRRSTNQMQPYVNLCLKVVCHPTIGLSIGALILGFFL